MTPKAISQKNALAIDGGKPVRSSYLSYGRHQIDEDDIQAVTAVLRSDWITQGPTIGRFEQAFAERVGAKFAVAFNSGTSALHGCVYAAGLGPGHEAITTPMTFAATANAVLYVGARPVFADVEDRALTIGPAAIQDAVTAKTKVVMPVDFAGIPCDLDEIMGLAARKGLVVIEDAAHALGGKYRGRSVGQLADMTMFSFHPVKHITTGEGGMVTTNNPDYAQRLRLLRSHGIQTDAAMQKERGAWFYEMVALGHNYRMTDLAAALGLSQLKKLDANLARRRAMVRRYLAAARRLGLRPLLAPQDTEPAWHLFPVRLPLEGLVANRRTIFDALRAENVGVHVHYIPVHLHPYYRQRFGYKGGEFPIAEAAYERLLTLPLHPGMNDGDVDDVSAALEKVLTHYSRR